MADPKWLGFYNEGHIVAAIVYFVICLGASRYRHLLEQRLAS
ncbi:hypothetical protein SAMCCGM7_pB0265 (plasmid) [Sinorhizobium americanum CCGM7]|nr:hypothetical protein SAMCCGM7_pB0265 [Sinorhizobium americanum CCGM7]